MAPPVDADDACNLPSSKKSNYDLTGDSTLSVVTPEDDWRRTSSER